LIHLRYHISFLIIYECYERVIRQMSLYHPDGLYVWDTWYLNMEGEIHVFYLQMKRSSSTRDLPENASLGHAVSKDLHNWEELPTSILPGKKGTYDDGHIFTGCALEHDGSIYLYYTSNHSEKGQRTQGICLAISEDGIHFTKHQSNPIIEPDPEIYISKSTDPVSFHYHNWPTVDCRDIVIIPSPTSDGWLGYVVMRLKEAGMQNSCCVALCDSKDLIHWKVNGPCCMPRRFTCFEVPDVFKLNDKWYMIALTADSYGQRARFSDPNCRHATIVFESNSPRGLFEEVRDNLLLASKDHQGFSARTVEYEGKRLMFYTRPEGGWPTGGSNWGQISWPVELVTNPGGGLLPRFWNGNERAFENPISLDEIQMEAKNGWTLRTLPLPSEQPDEFMLKIRVKFDACAVGISFHRKEDRTFGSGKLLLWDRDRSELELCMLPDFRTSQCRRFKMEDDKFDLRLIVLDNMIEAYMNDELLLNEFWPSCTGRPLQIFCENGKANFRNIKFFQR